VGLSGTASEGYRRALETAAGVDEASGNVDAAFPLMRREVEIGDRCQRASLYPSECGIGFRGWGGSMRPSNWLKTPRRSTRPSHRISKQFAG
jgi:hypothetical protein